MIKVSPLAPDRFSDMPPVPGARIAAIEAGVRYQGRLDLMLARFRQGTTVAGVLTQSLTAAAPVAWCRRSLQLGQASALLVNSGNANAFSGQAGQTAMERSIEAVADLFPCRPSSVFVASTGVIGEVLPDDRIAKVLPPLADKLDEDGWEAVARAIMTTDTYPKGATRTAMIGDKTVTINGIAKGSGMIAPDMATMLAFVFTDAAIPAPALQEILNPAVDASFNAITVDGDTSTSDTLLLFATGAAGNDAPASANAPALDGFKAALNEVLLDLAHQVVRDGEGASKFVAITVTGAESDRAAKRIGLSIANSPLVKTAIAGEDPNWGRVVMAVGKAGERADRDRLSVRMGGVLIAENGGVVEGYDEAPVAEHMKGRDIVIETDVGVGDGRATVWTCDLTHEYIDINADYRT